MSINKETYPATGLMFVDKTGLSSPMTKNGHTGLDRTVAEVEKLPHFLKWEDNEFNRHLGLIEGAVETVPEVAAFDDPDNPVPELLPCKPIRKAGLGQDPLDVVMRTAIEETRDFTKELLLRILKHTSHQNFGRGMHLIARVARAQAEFTVDMLPGVERFEQGEDRPGGLGEGNDLPSIETFGASMMKELTAHLSGQNAEKNKPDINRLMSSLEKAQEMGQDKVVAALQKKIDEVVESGEFVAKEWVSVRAIGALPPAEVPPKQAADAGGFGSGRQLAPGLVECEKCGFLYLETREECPHCPDPLNAEKEDRDADDVVSPEDQR